MSNFFTGDAKDHIFNTKAIDKLGKTLVKLASNLPTWLVIKTPFMVTVFRVIIFLNNTTSKIQKELVTNSPKKCGYVFERWTANWLGKHLAKEFAIELSDRHINRLLKKLGLSTKPLSAKTDETISQNAKRKNIAIRDLTSEQNVNSDLETLTFNTLVI